MKVAQTTVYNNYSKIKKLKRCGACNETLLNTFSAEQRKAHKATWQKLKVVLEK